MEAVQCVGRPLLFSRMAFPAGAAAREPRDRRREWLLAAAHGDCLLPVPFSIIPRVATFQGLNQNAVLVSGQPVEATVRVQTAALREAG